MWAAPAKCPKCCVYYGAPWTHGLCSRCFVWPAGPFNDGLDLGLTKLIVEAAAREVCFISNRIGPDGKRKRAALGCLALPRVSKRWRAAVIEAGPYLLEMPINIGSPLLTTTQVMRILTEVGGGRLFTFATLPLDTKRTRRTAEFALESLGRSLRVLVLHNARTLAGVAHCTNMHTLRLVHPDHMPSEAPNLAIHELRRATALTSLDIQLPRSDYELDIEELAGCLRLKHLTLRMKVLESREQPNLQPNLEVSKLILVSKHTALSSLTLVECQGADVASLVQCASLRSLVLQSCCCLSNLLELRNAPLELLQHSYCVDEPVTRAGLLQLEQAVKQHAYKLKIEPPIESFTSLGAGTSGGE